MQVMFMVLIFFALQKNGNPSRPTTQLTCTTIVNIDGFLPSTSALLVTGCACLKLKNSFNETSMAYYVYVNCEC